MPNRFFEIDDELRCRDYRVPDTMRLYVSPEQFLGRHVGEVLPAEVVDKVLDAVTTVLQQAGPATFDYSLSQQEGQRFFRAALTPHTAVGSTRYVVLVHEVSDLVRARREMHHRVKNNLSLVASLVNLKDSDVPGVDLFDLRSQVEAVRFVHERLQSAEEQEAINLQEYLSELVSGVLSPVSGDGLELELDVEAVQVDSKKAVSIGLLVNELATNAVKHGFAVATASPKRFSLSLTDQRTQLVLQVSNTGSTMPEHIDLHAAESLGLQLISGLVEQLGGSIELRRREDPCFEITLPT